MRNYATARMVRLRPREREERGMYLLLVLAAGAATPHVGRYVRAEGLSPVIAVGSASGKMDSEPYSASYLPRKEGPLSKENDGFVGREVADGWNGCDLIHQAIKDNAHLASS